MLAMFLRNHSTRTPSCPMPLAASGRTNEKIQITERCPDRKRGFSPCEQFYTKRGTSLSSREPHAREPPARWPCSPGSVGSANSDTSRDLESQGRRVKRPAPAPNTGGACDVITGQD